MLASAAPLALGLLFGLLAVSGVIVGAALVMALRRFRADLLALLVAFAVGTLLGAAFLVLLPESAAVLDLEQVGGLAVLGVLGFWLLQQWVLWRHCHEPNCRTHFVAGYLILVGDGIHNLTDGLLLGAAFVASPIVGVAMGLAVLAHEIPQEVGDFVLLLESGLSPARALGYNLLSAATIFPGVLAGIMLAEAVETAAAVALAFAIGGFLFIALADLIPHLHARTPRGGPALLWQVPPLLAGVTLIWAIRQLGSG